MKRALRDAAAKKIGAHTHCSKKGAIRDYLPYLKIIMEGTPQQPQESADGHEYLELEKEDLTAIKS